MKLLRIVNQCYSIIAILVLVLCFDIGQGQDPPQKSPCPEIFKYRLDGFEWIGIIELRGIELGQQVDLAVELSLRERLPTAHPGSLQLLIPLEETLRNLVKDKPVIYRVRFPLPTPIPRITKILFNKSVICSGPAETASYVTAINLYHTLYTQRYAGQPLTNQIPDPIIHNDNQHREGPVHIQLFGDFDSTTTSVPTEAPLKSPHPVQSTFNPVSLVTKTTVAPVRERHPQTDESALLKDVCGNAALSYNGMPLVVGGDEIVRGSWPWLAAIFVNKPNTLAFVCGGSLVSKKAIVTSAHCFFSHSKKYLARDVIVFLGRHNMRDWSEEGAVTASADSIYTHPDYHNGGNFDADLAVILMRKDVRFTEFIRPVCFWSEPDDFLNIEKQIGVIVGWGRNEADEAVSSRPKRVEATVVSNDDCIHSNEQFRLLTSNRTFCAGNKNGEGPCTGDSGGGFMIRKNNKWYLRGTVSASILDPVRNTCDLSYYVIYGDTAKFVNWIKRFMYI